MMAAFSSEMRKACRDRRWRGSRAREGRTQAAIGRDSAGRTDRDRVFGAGEIAQPAGNLRQPVGVGNDVVEKLAPVS